MQIREHISEWLSPIDAFWAIQLIRKQKLFNVLEIGVYKGAWVAAVLDNIPESKCFGIDPYPGLKNIEEIMNKELMNYKSQNRYKHFSNVFQLDTRLKFNICHIDGEHSEEALKNDLNQSYIRLLDGGIIVIDDFMNRIFPGVTSSTIIEAVKLDLKPILITEHKIYLVKSKDHVDLMRIVYEIRDEFDLGVSSEYRNGSYGESYTQDGRILEVNPFIQARINNFKIYDLLNMNLRVSRTFRSALYFITPPLFKIFWGHIIRIFRH